MITVNSIRDIPAGAIRAISQPDGTVLVYMPGDTLPPKPPVVDTPEVPQSITRQQGRAQLAEEGLIEAVENYIESLHKHDRTRMAYEDATVWEINNPHLRAMLTMLGKDDAAAAAFFTAAAAG